MRGADKTGGLNGLPKLPSTPACAGLTRSWSRWPAARTLYPRMRGADLSMFKIGRIAGPLSPRARGCLGHHERPHCRLASTPACAGLTSSSQAYCRRDPLYPRVRGADKDSRNQAQKFLPLPPRARGCHTRRQPATGVVPSTPACAGLPSPETCSSGDPTPLPPRARG